MTEVSETVREPWMPMLQLRSSRQLVAGEEYGLAHTTLKLPPLLARLLCRLGCHDFRIVNKEHGFGMSGGIETVECRRCGATLTRQA